jgi:hypothetical protein
MTLMLVCATAFWQARRLLPDLPCFVTALLRSLQELELVCEEHMSPPILLTLLPCRASVQGTLGESSMVCGVTSECTASHRPAYDCFEPIGVLLEKVRARLCEYASLQHFTCTCIVNFEKACTKNCLRNFAISHCLPSFAVGA